MNRCAASLSRIEAGSLTDQVKQMAGVSVLAAQVNAADMDSLRNIVDEMKTKLGSAVIVLGAVAEDKVNLVAAVTPDLVAKGFHAGKIIKEVAGCWAEAAADVRIWRKQAVRMHPNCKDALSAVEGLVSRNLHN